jgi:nicotinamide-nucleotide amidase
MKKVIYVGEELYENKPLKEYVERDIVEKFDANIVEYFAQKDNKLHDKIVKKLASFHEVLILSSEQNYNFLSKILATLTGGSLELTEGELIPSTAIAYDKRSFIVQKEQTVINLLEVKQGVKLPSLLLDVRKEEEVFYLLDIDEESCRVLTAPLMKSFDVKIATTTLVDGLVMVRAKSKKYGNAAQFVKAIGSLFSTKIIPSDNLAGFVIEALRGAGKSVTFAESCTGGKIASWLVEESGASDVFLGSVVSYANIIKASWLDVQDETLKEHGAVSEPCVKEMAKGAVALSSSDYAVSVSGIAGPDGGSREKPVGTVYIGTLCKGDLPHAVRYNLNGDREYIQEQAKYAAIKGLIDCDRKLFQKK